MMLQRPFIDLNILLDVLAQREPYAIASSQVWSVAETGQVHAMVSADSFSTLYYLLRRYSDAKTAKRGLSLVLDVFHVIALDEKMIRQSLQSTVKDFEDAVQYLCALHGPADCLVTRDIRHYRKAEIPVMKPEEFLRQFTL